MATISFKHSGHTGDIIYALSAIYYKCVMSNVEAKIYIKLDVPSTYKEGQHPMGSVMMNRKTFDMLKPLLESQDYIRSCEVYEGQAIDYDLDLFREDRNAKNLSGGDIKLWHHFEYPELTPNTISKCLTLPYEYNDAIILNRSIRYNNPLIDYSILEGLGHPIWFVGVDDEFKIISKTVKCEHKQVKDFLELATLINGCRLFVGNQSMAFAIAEQLKVDRILEQYYLAPNVIPQGGKWAFFQTQKQFEKIIELNGKIH